MTDDHHDDEDELDHPSHPDVLPGSAGLPHDGSGDAEPITKRRRPPERVCGSMNGATKRQGRPCGNSAGKRTDHVGWGQCWLHGGNTPAGKAHAARLQAEHEAEVLEATAKRYMVPVDMDPRDGLLEEVARAAGWLRYWDGRVNALEEEALAGVLKTGHKSGYNSQGLVNESKWEAANHIVVVTWERARRDFVRVCKDAAQAGVEERRVQLAEEQGQLLAQVVEMIVVGLGRSMDEADVEVVVRGAMASAVGRHLSVA